MRAGRFRPDIVTLVAVAVGLVYVALYSSSMLPPEWMEIFSANWAEPPLLILLLVALLHGLRQSTHAEERRFWGLLAACFALWVVGAVSNSLVVRYGVEHWLGLGVDSLFLLSFLTCFLAVDQRPHLEPGWSRGDPTYAISTLGSLLFIQALVLYFFVFPFIAQGGSVAGDFPNTFLIISLDVLLAIRFFHLVSVCRDRWWRRAYAVLGIASVFWIVTDTLEWMIREGHLRLAYGTPWDALWYLPFLMILFVRRSRSFDAARVPPLSAGGATRRSLTGQPDAPLLLLLYAFLLPACHLTLGGLGALPPEGRYGRELLVLFGLLAFAALAAGQQLLLLRRNRELSSEITVMVSNEKLQRAQKMEAIGRLAGGLAHDFNNLLTVVKGNAQLLARKTADDAIRIRLAEQIVQASDRAGSLTRHLLAFSRGQVLQPTLLNLCDVVREAVPMLRRLLGEKIAVDTVLDVDPAVVRADSGQLHQVVLNLAVNARDAMPDGGRLTLQISVEELTSSCSDALPPATEGTYVVLSASDTGCGMDEETRAHIFEPFFTGKAGGTGLGLATVYGIVAQSHGFLRVESEPHQGTRIRAYLPLVHAEVEGQNPESPSRQPEDCLEGVTILLVEDDPSVRSVVAELLEMWKVEFVEACDAEQALGLFEREGHRIDLVVTDIVMPGLSGPQMIRRLRETRPGLRVLYISGYSREELEGPGGLGPHDAFLSKPLDFDAFRSKLIQLLRSSESPSSGSPARRAAVGSPG